ncbi:MAG: NAD(P)H-dependent oxidoreductase [Bifidobacterium longum]|nr:NAD(P)H-dependent oxidoreductase [Bifidobacterium longum]
MKAEQKAVEEANRIVFQFPIFWFSSSALSKEWEDKVLEHGWAYGSEDHAFEGKEFGVAVSTGSPESAYQTGTPATTPSSSCLFRSRARLITSARPGSSRSPRTALSASPTRPSPSPLHSTRHCSPSNR